MKPDLKAIAERHKIALSSNLDNAARSLHATDLLIEHDIPALLAYIAELKAVVQAAREAKQHDYITPELSDALAKLDNLHSKK